MLTAEIRVNGALIGVLSCVARCPVDPGQGMVGVWAYSCRFQDLDIDTAPGQPFTVAHRRDDGAAALVARAMQVHTRGPA
jgi:hypothetical protein